MCGAECVVDVGVCIGRERGRERRVVRLLLGMESQVLEHQDVALAEPRDRGRHRRAEAVVGRGDGAAEQLTETRRDRRHAELVNDRALRAAEVTGEDHPRATPDQQLDGGQRRADPGVVGDDAVLERHVEVDTDEDALPRSIEVAHAAERHGGSFPHAATGTRDATSEMRSAIRQL